MRHTIVTMIAIGLLSLHGAPSLAAPSGSKMATAEAELTKRFDKADANRDGQVTRDEVKGVMPRVYTNFAEIDTARKGALTLNDIKAYVLNQLQQRQ